MSNKKFVVLLVLVIALISFYVYKASDNNMDQLKKEITKQSSQFTGTKTLEDKFRENWYNNNSNTKILKSYFTKANKDGNKEFTIAFQQDNYIKIAVVTAVESQGQTDFIVENNITTDGQKLLDFRFVKFKGKQRPFLLVHVVTNDGFHYLSIYGEDKAELLRVDGNGGIIVKDYNGDNIPEIVPITKTGETKESSTINVYQWINNRFVEVDYKKFIPKSFATEENMIKYFFNALRQGNKSVIKSCFSKEVQRNFSDKDFQQIANLYNSNAKLIKTQRDPSIEQRISVYYYSKATKGRIDFNLIQEKGYWVINDIPSMLIPGKTVF